MVQMLLTAGADINKCFDVSKGLNSVYVIDIHIMSVRCCVLEYMIYIYNIMIDMYIIVIV